jgi:hypothetical protein
MKFVHQECYSLITEECSKDAHKRVNYDYEQTMKCVDSSFDQGKSNDELW